MGLQPSGSEGEVVLASDLFDYVLDMSAAEPLRLSLTLLIQGRGEELEVSNEVELGLNLQGFGTVLLQSENVQASFDRLVNEAAYRCPTSPSNGENFDGLEYQTNL